MNKMQIYRITTLASLDCFVSTMMIDNSSFLLQSLSAEPQQYDLAFFKNLNWTLSSQLIMRLYEPTRESSFMRQNLLRKSRRDKIEANKQYIWDDFN